MSADAVEVEVQVDGDSRRLPAGASVEDVVRGSGRDPRTVAVEQDGEIPRRAGSATRPLAAGDRLGIAHFLRGG